MRTRKLLSLFMLILLIVSLCACGGSFAQVNLQQTQMIPEDGIIEKNIIQTIQEEHAIGCFQGESNGFIYEWTIFGSDISKTRDIHLDLEISDTTDGISVSFIEAEPFGFPALLSIHLHETWDSLSATAYQQEQAVYSVSLTGTKNTILNLSINDVMGQFFIRPDEMQNENSTEVVLKTDLYQENGYLSAVPTGDEQVYSQNPTVTTVKPSPNVDSYLSSALNVDGRVYSDGSSTEKDQYLTDTVPEGKPIPVEPENQDINKENSFTCTFSIECSTILNNLSDLDPDKLEMVPSNGVILPSTQVIFYEGESVFDVLKRVCIENNIHMEASWTPIYNSAYVEGIHNLYEFDCGNLSGWMYRVNGWYPNYGCSRYQLAQDDVVEWRYTCDLGRDVGGNGFE